MRVGSFGALGTPQSAAALCDAIAEYAAEFSDPGSTPVSFVATFDEAGLSETGFERQLWMQLQCMHAEDASRGFRWDSQVNHDPDPEDISFSGMRPAKSS